MEEQLVVRTEVADVQGVVRQVQCVVSLCVLQASSTHRPKTDGKSLLELEEEASASFVKV